MLSLKGRANSLWGDATFGVKFKAHRGSTRIQRARQSRSRSSSWLAGNGAVRHALGAGQGGPGAVGRSSKVVAQAGSAVRAYSRRRGLSEAEQKCRGRPYHSVCLIIAGKESAVKKKKTEGVSQGRVKGSQRAKKGEQPQDGGSENDFSAHQSGYKREQKQQERPEGSPAFWESTCCAVLKSGYNAAGQR